MLKSRPALKNSTWVLKSRPALKYFTWDVEEQASPEKLYLWCWRAD
jgi:hypothetical protein